LDKDLTKHFKHLEFGEEPEEVDSTDAAAEKSVDEKVSEIRMFVEIVIDFVCFKKFICIRCLFV